MKSEKRHMMEESNCQIKNKSERNKHSGILEVDTIKQVERKNGKRVPQKNQKTTGTKTISQKPCQRYK